MSLHRQIARGLTALFRHAATDRNIRDEVEHYLEQSTAAYEAAGLRRDEAQRAARVDLGSRTSVQTQIRTSGWESAIDTTVADLRHGVRRLRNSPGFTAVTAITLALGVAASTTIFSAVKPLLMEALPYPDA